jgi:hypothetical protein
MSVLRSSAAVYAKSDKDCRHEFLYSTPNLLSRQYWFIWGIPVNCSQPLRAQSCQTSSAILPNLDSSA